MQKKQRKNDVKGKQGKNHEAGKIRLPHHLSEYAKVCLKALTAKGLEKTFSLGGAVGLMHFLDYRPTNDVDAWWSDSVTEKDRKEVLSVVTQSLQLFGRVKIRAWGDVTSVECEKEGKTVFSFQIANRSVQLQPSSKASWAPILVDSLQDLVASKMVALIERGAPRDFRDIYALCESDLISPSYCWELWKKRQRAVKSDIDGFRARTAIETHLARIIQHRPLETIEDVNQRSEAEQVRQWFMEVFLNALEA